MKRIGRLASWLVLIVNAVFACLLLLAAYSPYINPAEHPVRVCIGFIFPVFVLVVFAFLLFWVFVRPRFALLSLAALLVCFPQIRIYVPFNFHTDDIPTHSVKLLSYNVMGFGEARKPMPHNEILSYIKSSRADIICMQEYHVTNSGKFLSQADVDGALKDYPYKNIHKIGLGKSNALACYSKYPILSARPVQYRSQANGSMIYEIKAGDIIVTLINNHLESNKLTPEDRRVYEDMITTPETEKVKSGTIQLVKKLGEAMTIRARQADVVAKEIDASPHPYIIVCGDFNDTPISYARHKIKGNLKDAFAESGRGMGVTYNRYNFRFRIDYILYSNNIKSYNCEIGKLEDSDHYPVSTYLQFVD